MRAALGGSRPQVISYDNEHERRHNEVEEQVEGVVAPGVQPRNGIVKRVGDHEDTPDVNSMCL
jgi:hypothetical protein